MIDHKIALKLRKGDTSDFLSRSEAELAYCEFLAGYYGDDAEAIDCEFRKSSLIRDKWNRKQSGSTYGKLVIEKAIQNVWGQSPIGEKITFRDNSKKQATVALIQQKGLSRDDVVLLLETLQIKTDEEINH